MDYKIYFSNPWVKYKTIDKDGTITYHEKYPVPDNTSGKWVSSGRVVYKYPLEPDWADSLTALQKVRKDINTTIINDLDTLLEAIIVNGNIGRYFDITELMAKGSPVRTSYDQEYGVIELHFIMDATFGDSYWVNSFLYSADAAAVANQIRELQQWWWENNQ